MLVDVMACSLETIHRPQIVCTLCPTGNVGDEQHIILSAQQEGNLRDRYNGLFGDHAVTMDQFMWQHNINAVAQFIKEL